MNYIKKIITSICLAFLTLTVYAQKDVTTFMQNAKQSLERWTVDAKKDVTTFMQNAKQSLERWTVYSKKDVTTFMGIPVNGTESAMRRKLIAKGFKAQTNSNFLKGEFNGRDVQIAIVTNKNKVYRIVVIYYKGEDENFVNSCYNNLVKSFKNNVNYYTYMVDSLPDAHDLSYEMKIYKKEYEACFYQNTNFNKLVFVKLSYIDCQYCLLIYYDNKDNSPKGKDL